VITRGGIDIDAGFGRILEQSLGIIERLVKIQWRLGITRRPAVGGGVRGVIGRAGS
jgi:hypothetical protein